MGGQGKKKAEWNIYLNEDVVAGNLAQFLAESAKRVSFFERYSNREKDHRKRH